MKRLLLMFTVLFVSTAGNQALGCVCMLVPNPTPEWNKAARLKAFQEATAVFTGEVVDLDTFNVKVKVAKFWKGQPSELITMITGTKALGSGRTVSSSCDYHFSLGQKYLIYAYGNSHELKTWVCSRTQELEKADSELAALDEIVPHTDFDLVNDSAPAPVRTVSGQVLTSSDLPAVRIKFADAFKYLGTQSFVLYDVANAEQHFFVDADKENHIRRLYWVQFEGYLPTNSHSYDYKINKTVNLGGLDFIADAFARNTKGNTDRANSDSSRARAFLESKGYRLADGLLAQRLVHLVDNAKRNELMIIYVEDLSLMGVTAADLAQDGRAAGQWDQIATALLERATKGMTFSR